MSRRIVAIAAVPSLWPDDGEELPHTLYALDNNGVAWQLDGPNVRSGAAWRRLPELPNVPLPRSPRIDVTTPDRLEGTEP